MTDATKFTQKLKGIRVLIIGGSSGLGYSVAEGVLEHGGSVIISSSSTARLSTATERLASSYPSASARISSHPCDLSTAATLEAQIKALFEFAGTVDHVIYSAGDRLALGPFSEQTLETIQQAGMVRFFGPLLVAKYVAAHLSGGPRSSYIITTGSISQKPNKGWTIPAGYAAGIHGMVRQLALDLAPIRVNGVSPGAVSTEMWNHLGEEGVQKFHAVVGGRALTGRIARPEDLAEAYLFLLRDENVTGSIISSNGGSLMV